ncbi:MAG: anaerobic glycerol-3-phosphate dehydrogenase subunit C [Desulfovibrio sp.]|nr:anaerobic glycerol-3-phosphate dehydrogenase subunit C [Desulfovibrio sp.]
MRVHLSPDKCIACTTCVVQCPVAEATTKFLGPRMIGPAYERFRLLGLTEDSSLQYCANCKNCDISCPQGVPVSSLNMLARAEQCARLGHSFRDWILAHGELMATWLRHIPAPLKNFGMLNPLTRTALDALGIHRQAPLPAFAPHTFRESLRRMTQPGHSRKILFFPGCYIDVYNPQTGLDMVWALNSAGYDVIVPDELVCCGLPMVANGFWNHAHANAERNLQVLARWRNAGLPCITACPSCALMFRSDLPEYFPDLIKKYGMSPLNDAQEFLLDAFEDTLSASTTDQPVNVCHLVYHAPCHLRAQGNGLPGLDLLRRLPGVYVDYADAGCCGISGSYGFKKEKYDIAQTVGSRLFARVRESGATAAVSECGTCRVQIRHGTGLTTLHPVNVLRKFLDTGC